MYTRYFGLTEKPFAIAPNPKYLYMSHAHREALAHLLYGINGEGCIVLLTGDIGTGKTTVCRCLIEQLPPNTDVAIILNPKLSIEEILQTTCEELGITVPVISPTVKTYIDLINAYLLETHSNGRNTALIIDEAQNLDSDILEHLRLLTNLETNSQKLLQIVLIGQPELRQTLEAQNLEQVNQRITTRFHLGPLEKEDVHSYVQHRIEVAGGAENNRLFDAKGLNYIARASKGIPRVINSLCDRSLLGAYSENQPFVSHAIIKKAAKELRYGSNTSNTLYKKSLYVLLFFCLLISIPAIMYLTTSFKPTTWGQRFFQSAEKKASTTTNPINAPQGKNISTVTIHPLVKQMSPIPKLHSTNVEEQTSTTKE
ncbi:MAG: AAA family ATPase [Desulfobulbaceae bacterium]|nr:AAA family ATPase [Desulfobulbaceae bacterium]